MRRPCLYLWPLPTGCWSDAPWGCLVDKSPTEPFPDGCGRCGCLGLHKQCRGHHYLCKSRPLTLVPTRLLDRGAKISSYQACRPRQHSCEPQWCSFPFVKPPGLCFWSFPFQSTYLRSVFMAQRHCPGSLLLSPPPLLPSWKESLLCHGSSNSRFLCWCILI